MASPNYATAGSLNDARELQKMFKGQSSGNSSGKNRGKSKGTSNSLPMKRQETFTHPHRGPPPTFTKTNVPPPSARYYTATLLSDPLKRAPGTILGSASVAFLKREDSASHTPATPIQTKPSVAGNQVTNPTVSAVAAAEGKQNHAQGQDEMFETGSKNHASALAAPRAAVSDSNAVPPRGLATDQDKATVKAPTAVSAGETEVVNKEEESKKTIANTFFSLMSRDSDEESDGEPPAALVQDEAVNKSITTIFLKYSSDEILKLKSNAEKDVLPSDSIVRRANSKGKATIAAISSQAMSHLARVKQDLKTTTDSFTSKSPGTGIQAANGATANVAQSVKPQATVSQHSIKTVENYEILFESNLRAAVKIPQTAGTQQNGTKPQIAEDLSKLKLGSTKTERADPSPSQTRDEGAKCTVPQQQHQGKAELSSESTDNTSLRPEAPGFVPTVTPELASLLANGSNKPAEAHSLAGNFIRSTCLSGQMIIITPIRIADGQLISGPPSSQLVMQPTTPATNQMPSLNIPASDPFAVNSPFLGVEKNINGLTANASKARKPTKGLGSSMWAK
ncbi:hypothetical protein FLAG1_02219 [Fusarium langsethiae]|uniref:Uncharacterized protein n=1 Tax=Fusarium langsethiae TaxID=179993 RepID=A0A0N0DH30_FUSLA|nr:hypothetical protein FLAG1_02219 [Fusarium langsethiae]GKU02446.1 unnamed protein product [Fusarium langsethiae]GKU12361.1 unnamed protein product [Fusarium langsethiae]